MRLVSVLAFAAASLLPPFAPAAQAQEPLRAQIRALAQAAKGKVAVACSLPGTALNCDLNPDAHAPMQSVFKLPLAMEVLHLVEEGKLSLDQPVRFLPDDRILPEAYSPLWDKYPDANVEVPLRELLRLTVALSDNVAADILLRITGGPAALDAYVHGLGIAGFHIQDDEKVLHAEVAAQYRDWFEPAAAVALLRRISDRSPLNPADTAMLLAWMQPPAKTARLQADLPDGTVFAHRTGTSDTDHGLAHATNDMALVTLPDGRRLALAVFVTDSTADQPTREKAMARIGRAIYDAALTSRP